MWIAILCTAAGAASMFFGVAFGYSLAERAYDRAQKADTFNFSG